MRILVDNGEHQHRNRGDVAMLQVAVQRLAALWPHDEVGVLTGDPARLAALVPGAHAVTLADGWRGPGMGRRLARAAERRARVGANRWVDRVLEDVGLLVAGGGGYLTDVDPEQTERVLTLIDGANARRIPALMFGQGLGPLHDTRLRSLATRALPGVRQLALREGRRGPDLARELGVPDDALVVTGDDAVALARPGAPEQLGVGIAVNHRIAHYMGGGDETARVMRSAVQRVAFDRGVPLIPIPVSEWDDDRPGISLITRGYPDVAPAGSPADPPLVAIRRLDAARLVVTTTYHLAVFALSRGVPAVCPASSDYYWDKFAGLAELFAPGCTVVDMQQRDAEERLREAIDRLWCGAEDVRPALLAAADRQIASGEGAYREARRLLDGL